MPLFHIEWWLAMIGIRRTCFELAWVDFTERKQTTRVHVCDWTNETGLREGGCYDKYHTSYRHSVSFVPKFWYKLYKQLFTIKYKNSYSLCGNTYANENLNQAKISNRYEKLHFLLIIFPVFMSTKLPIQWYKILKWIKIKIVAEGHSFDRLHQNATNIRMRIKYSCQSFQCHCRECREQSDTNREKQWFGSQSSRVHSSYFRVTLIAILSVRRTYTNVLNRFKHSCLSSERRRMQNNVTRTWEERSNITMNKRCV